MTSKWVDTIDILAHPERFSDKHIVMGFKHSLVSSCPVPSSIHKCLNGIRVQEIVHHANCWHVLIHCDSLDEFNELRSDLSVQRMNLPDSSGILDHYIISARLPDGVMLSCHHTVSK